MAQSVNKEKSIEQFCTFVGITIGIGVIPILENAANNVRLKTIFGLIIVFLDCVSCESSHEILDDKKDSRSLYRKVIAAICHLYFGLHYHPPCIGGVILFKNFLLSNRCLNFGSRQT